MDTKPRRRLRPQWKFFLTSAVVAPLMIGCGVGLHGLAGGVAITWGVCIALGGIWAFAGGVGHLDSGHGYFEEKPTYGELAMANEALRSKLSDLENINEQLTDGLISPRLGEVTIPPGGTAHFVSGPIGPTGVGGGKKS